MISSTSCSERIAGAVVVMALATGCAASPMARVPRVAPTGLRIAVLPLENLSGTDVPLDGLRRGFVERLTSAGVSVLDDERLAAFMAAHRVRWVGGIDDELSRRFAEETGVEAVLAASVDLYDDGRPPKLGLVARLVEVGRTAVIRWADAVARSGDDDPGFLELGRIANARILQGEVLDTLASSLLGALGGSGGATKSASSLTKRRWQRRGIHRVAARPVDGRFATRELYRCPEPVAGAPARVAVLPFSNETDHAHAGEILALEFVHELARQPGRFIVIEPGVVRQALLTHRIIMTDGPSLKHAQTLFDAVQADLIVVGRVFAYEEYDGALQAPRVDFSTLALAHDRARVVWSSASDGGGNDGVYFFGHGRIRTAPAMALAMVRRLSRAMPPGRESP